MKKLSPKKNFHPLKAKHPLPNPQISWASRRSVFHPVVARFIGRLFKTSPINRQTTNHQKPCRVKHWRCIKEKTMTSFQYLPPRIGRDHFGHPALLESSWQGLYSYQLESAFSGSRVIADSIIVKESPFPIHLLPTPPFPSESSAQSLPEAPSLFRLRLVLYPSPQFLKTNGQC